MAIAGLACAPALGQDVPGWRMTWSDEFNGSTLDPTKWRAEDAALVKNNEQQYYSPANVSLVNGELVIRAERRFQGGRPFTSGLVESINRFSQAFGRFEARMKLPRTQGLWPAFWMLQQAGGWPPEIDIMELLGHQPTTVYMSNHWGVWPNNAWRTTSFTGPDFTQTYNTFAVEWWPDRLDFFVNGFRRATHVQNVPQTPFYIILNTAVGGLWPGNPDTTTVFPQFMNVDWVRVYQPILQNASFESLGPGVNAPMFGWNAWGNSSLDPGVGRTGGNSVKIFGNFSGGFNSSGVFQEINATPGRRYRASASWLTPGNDRILSPNFAAINIEWRNAAGSMISFVSTTGITSTSALNTWLDSEVRGIAPAGTTRARVVAIFLQNNNAGGSVRVDDIDLREVFCPADFNADWQVDQGDFVQFAAAYNDFLCDASCPEDLNGDSVVDNTDFVIFAQAYSEFLCP